ncbi:MFS transporter [Amnibacterium endophyticum]|uniref:MFS transporter n=1 Tax=Amnibacterium endophyticum TaxID=2109337 RepID=A0ABW4LEW6_9MICO
MTAIASGSMFRSLRVRDYRLWASGAIVSNVGTWMQRTAQDWIVLTRLTQHDAFAVGVTTALQFGPQLLLLPVTGLVADRVPRRTLLLCTQAVMGVLALALGLLVVTDSVTLAQVYVFAFLGGCTAAFDAPARQSFVSDLVGQEHVSNAVALNSASFNLARLLGPAVAGLLIEVIGTGWVFLLNAVSFAAVLASLRAIRPVPDERPARPRGLREAAAGLQTVVRRPDLLVVFGMVAVMGTFGLNFPIYASTMAVLFHQGASGYGLLSSALAVGAVAGALLSARRSAPRTALMTVGAAVFAAGLVVGALAPSYLVLALALPFVGVASQTFMTTANGIVQLGVDAVVRGRVMALYMATVMGGTIVGGPVVGWVANALGPREGLMVGALAGVAAAATGLVRQRRTAHAVAA